MTSITLNDCMKNKNKKYILNILYQLYKIYPSNLTQKDLCNIIIAMSSENSEILDLYHKIDFAKKIIKVGENGYNPDELYKIKNELKYKKKSIEDSIDNPKINNLLIDSLNTINEEIIELKKVIPKDYTPNNNEIRNIIKEELDDYFKTHVNPILDNIQELNDKFNAQSSAITELINIINNNTSKIKLNTNSIEEVNDVKNTTIESNNLAKDLSIYNSELNKVNKTLINKLDEILELLKNGKSTRFEKDELDDIINKKINCEHELGIKIKELNECSKIKNELNDKIKNINSDYTSKINNLETELHNKELFINTLQNINVSKQFDSDEISQKIQSEKVKKAIDVVDNHKNIKYEELKYKDCMNQYNNLLMKIDKLTTLIENTSDEEEIKNLLKQKTRLRKEISEKYSYCDQLPK